LLRNGGTTPGAVGFVDDRIVALGPEDQVVSAMEGDVRVYRADGATIVPGFIDGHLHLSSLGEHLGSVDLAGCGSIEDMVRRVRDRAAGDAGDGWITGRGWDQDRFVEGRYPCARDLDRAEPDRPVVLRRACGHALVANTAALRAAGVQAQATDPVGGRFERDEGGRITGVLHETAMKPILDAIPRHDAATRREHLRRGIRRCHAAGITSVHTNEGGCDLSDLWTGFRNVGEDPDYALRAYLDLGPSFLEALGEAKMTTGYGDEYLKVGALKLFADGSLGARTALLSMDYADDPGNRGTYVIPPDEMRELIRCARGMGMQIAVHTIGDAALDSTLGLLERPGGSGVPDRVIHCQITREDQFAALAEADVIACVQPRFVATDMAWAEMRVGSELVRTSYAWNSLLRAGVDLAGGSDAPVEPVDPLLGIHAAVNRVDDAGEPTGGWNPAERIDLLEAFDLFGPGAAASEGAARIKGCLEVGYLADFVLLDRDPLEIDPGAIRDIRVLETWVGGRRVFGDTTR